MPAEKNQPLISVVVPVFKGANKLPTTLNSLLSQRPNSIWEAIVRDGSPDSAPGQSAIDSFLAANPGVNVRFIGGPDKGVYDAMNQGISASSGRFLYFLGAGDTVLDGIFEKISPILNECDAKNKASVVYGNWLSGDKNGTSGHEFTWLDFARKRNINHQAMLFSRGIFDKLGLYNIRYPIRADNIMNIRIWADPDTSKRYVPIPITRFEGGGLSDVAVDQPFHEDFDKVIAENFGFKGILVSKLVDIKCALTRSQK